MANGDFKRASDGSGVSSINLDDARVLVNIGLLTDNLRRYKTEPHINKPKVEADIRQRFISFLLGCGFDMAIEDFDQLLREKGSKETKKRRDGTISWYHELTPVLTFMSIAKGDGISFLEKLKKFGGLETAIRTHMRHDSVEDTGIDFTDFDTSVIQTFERVMDRLKVRFPDDYEARHQQELDRIPLVCANIRLMTRKVAEKDDAGELIFRPNGKIQKRALFNRTSDYIHNMIISEDSNPVVFMLKQLDGIHNLATLPLSEDFEGRLNYCNERENMYGSRRGFTHRAKRKWPEFEDAIEKLDNLMGVVLYLNFNWLEYVDLAYKDEPEGYRGTEKIFDSGIGRYLEDEENKGRNSALNIDLPDAFNPMHILLKRMIKVAQNDPDENRRIRASEFLQRSVCPVLEPYKTHFPYFFGNNDDTKKFVPQRNGIDGAKIH